MVGAVFAGSSEAFVQVCRNRRSSTDHLVGQTTESPRQLLDEIDCETPAASIAFRWAMNSCVGFALCMITSDSFMPLPSADGISEVKGRRRGDSSCP